MFIDTNVLDQGWPVLSPKVSNLVFAAQKFRASVEIPAPVLIELKRHWRDRTRKSIASAKMTLKEIAGLMGSPVGSDDFPEWIVIEQQYEAATTALLNARHINITPISTISLTTLFEQASERALVFHEKGQNFQDAVIFHSIVEKLLGLPANECGLLVSQDGVFEKRESDLEAYSKAKGVSLQLMKLDAAEQFFRDELDNTTKDLIAHHKALAITAVTYFLGQAQQIFNGTLLVPPPPGPLIRNAQFTGVRDVDVELTDAEPSIGSEVRLSAIVTGTMEEVRIMPSGSLDGMSAKRQEIEVGFIAVARYEANGYDVLEIQSFTYGWPSSPGSVGHPNWQQNTAA